MDPTPTQRAHIAFVGASPEQVDVFHGTNVEAVHRDLAAAG